MADPAAVARLLLARCEAMSIGSPVLPIAMPDVAFDPGVKAPDGRYLRVDLFNNAPLWDGLSIGRIDQGLLQVTVIWPKGKGTIKPLEAAAAVEAHFHKGLTLYGPGLRVKVNRSPWTASPLFEDSRTLIPVTIPWVAS